MGSDHPDVEQESQQVDIPQDCIDITRVPEERKNRARYASIAICAITAALVLIFCYTTRYEDVYSPYLANATNICYQKQEMLSFPGLFTTALGLFSVVLGTLVDRLSLVAEEYHHLSERYGGSRRKMFAACFSGISWGPVIFLIFITAIIAIPIISFTEMPWFELRYLVYIVSGIGVGPLVMHLLNLNSQSEVHISTILEEKGMYVANGLAWSYYFNFLQKALPEFSEKVRSSATPVSLNKLLLLIPHDCHIEDNLELTEYKNIKFKGYIHTTDYAFPVYRLTISEHEHENYAIVFVKEPLKTLKKMSMSKSSKAFKNRTCQEEVKLLYRTLAHEILDDPPDQNCKGTCILVPVMVNDLDTLKNGGLVKCIVQKLNTAHSLVDGFVELRANKQEEKFGYATKRTDCRATKIIDDGRAGKIYEFPISDVQQSDQVQPNAKGKYVELNKVETKRNIRSQTKQEEKDAIELQKMLPTGAECAAVYSYIVPVKFDQQIPNQPSIIAQEIGNDEGNINDGASTSGNVNNNTQSSPFVL